LLSNQCQKFAVYQLLPAVFHLEMTEDHTLSWAQVLEVHKTQQAVNFVGEKIASIICSPTQNKFVSEQEIIFSIPARKQYLKLIGNLKARISDNGPIHIFVKRDKNIWADAGFFSLISFDEDEIQTDFTLQKIES
jgi:hypothetical protein